jgi:CubicO group peptidase (beta-lactamase class C family)
MTSIRSARRFVAFAVLAFGAILLAGCASAPGQPGRIERGDYAAVAHYVDALIAHEMRANDVTGLSIAIVDDQQVVWSRGAGWADAAAKVPATADTVYRMGSISKLFTVTAALQLVQQGRLAIDAPIGQALPGFRIRSRYPDSAITPRRLMTHHAGMPRDLLRGMWGREVGDYRAMVAGLGDAELAYPPGGFWSYSNLGMTVLGAAVEQVAGEPFADHLQRSLLQPLGMRDAAFATAAPRATRAYDRGKPADEPALRDLPAGGLNASVLDMSRFLMMVFANGRAGSRTILEPALLAEMLRVQNADVPLDRDFRVGLGWMLTNFGGDPITGAGTVAHHAGATINFRSQMYALPEHKLGVIVAANAATSGKVVDRVAKRALTLALEASAGIRQQHVAADFQPANEPWPDEALQAWVGDYTTLAGHANIARRGNRLNASVAGRELQLLPGADGSMGLRYALLGLIPISLDELERVAIRRRDIDGHAVLVARSGGQELLVGERITPQAHPRAQRLVGDYQPVVAEGEYPLIEKVKITQESGVLVAKTTLRIGDQPVVSIPLRIVADDQTLLLGVRADAGEIVRLREVDGQIRFDFSGYEFRPMR